MPVRDLPIPIPTNLGLDLINPASQLQVGKLVLAQNKASGVWGPRHGNTRLDYNDRGRSLFLFDGVNDFATVPYNSAQLDRSLSFTYDWTFKLLANPTGVDKYLWAPDHALDDSVSLRFQVGTGRIFVNVVIASGSIELSNLSVTSLTTITNVRLIRDGGSLFLFVNGVVVDSSDNFTATGSSKVVAADRIIGKNPSFAAAGFLNFILGGVFILNYASYNTRSMFMELPLPHGRDVVGCWNGERENTTAAVLSIYDASRYGNHAWMTGGATNANIRVNDTFDPVQHVGYYTLKDGRQYIVVVVGGRLFAEAI